MKEYALKLAFFNFSKKIFESQLVVKSYKIAFVNSGKLYLILYSHKESTKSGVTKIVLILVCSQINLKASCPKVLYKVTLVTESR